MGRLYGSTAWSLYFLVSPHPHRCSLSLLNTQSIAQSSVHLLLVFPTTVTTAATASMRVAKPSVLLWQGRMPPLLLALHTILLGPRLSNTIATLSLPPTTPGGVASLGRSPEFITGCESHHCRRSHRTLTAGIQRALASSVSGSWRCSPRQI